MNFNKSHNSLLTEYFIFLTEFAWPLSCLYADSYNDDGWIVWGKLLASSPEAMQLENQSKMEVEMCNGQVKIIICIIKDHAEKKYGQTLIYI